MTLKKLFRKNRLDRLSLAILSSLIKYLQTMKHVVHPWGRTNKVFHLGRLKSYSQID
jgi:hypothetical protein